MGINKMKKLFQLGLFVGSAFFIGCDFEDLKMLNGSNINLNFGGSNNTLTTPENKQGSNKVEGKDKKVDKSKSKEKSEDKK